MGQGTNLSEVVVSAGDWPQPGPSWSSGVSDVGPTDLLPLEATTGAFCTPPTRLARRWLWFPMVAECDSISQGSHGVEGSPWTRSKLRLFP